mgnify:CR=1 FL=1
MSGNDPFNQIINHIETISLNKMTENKKIFIGVVKNQLPNLIVEKSGINLDKDNLMIDKWLLDRNETMYTETATHIHGGDTTGDGEHKHNIKRPIKNKLNIGDVVVMIREGDIFYIISKVVGF